jgi:hypothetical protein
MQQFGAIFKIFGRAVFEAIEVKGRSMLNFAQIAAFFPRINMTYILLGGFEVDPNLSSRHVCMMIDGTNNVLLNCFIFLTHKRLILTHITR